MFVANIRKLSKISNCNSINSVEIIHLYIASAKYIQIQRYLRYFIICFEIETAISNLLIYFLLESACFLAALSNFIMALKWHACFLICFLIGLAPTSVTVVQLVRNFDYYKSIQNYFTFQNLVIASHIHLYWAHKIFE